VPFVFKNKQKKVALGAVLPKRPTVHYVPLPALDCEHFPNMQKSWKNFTECFYHQLLAI
jgi:hypothetical protein